MESSGKRLWGIDVIAGVYGLGTLAMVWLCANGTDVGRTFGLLAGPVCLALCIGIAMRIDLVRKLLMVLLTLALVATVPMLAYLLGALAGWFDLPPNTDASEQLAKLPRSLIANAILLGYLWRPDVRAAFQR